MVLSARDADFQPMSNVVIDTFRIETNDVDLAFRANGSCGEVSKISSAGTFLCEIDGADPITGGAGDTNLNLDGGVDRGGTTVWAWTGDNEDAVGDDTDLYKLEISEAESKSIGVLARVSTEFSGAKAHQGSSVLYTVQLEDASGDPATAGSDGETPAKYIVTLDSWAIVDTDTNLEDDVVTLARNPLGFTLRTKIPLTTDADGKATFSVSALPDPAAALKRDKWSIDIFIEKDPRSITTPAAIHIGNSDTAGDVDTATGFVEVRAGSDTDATTPDALVFSTEASSRATDVVSVSVKPAADYVVASARGSSNRATVSVVDQYGDPIPGARVSLSSSETGVTIGGGRALAVGRDGTYTFGYEREAATQATETLTPRWDHDNDGCHAEADCTDDAATENVDESGTAGIAGTTDTVEWALPASADQTDQEIRAFDTETDTIFAGGLGTVWMITYDSNDRFDLGAAGTETASNYAAFERALNEGLNLDWDITGTGSRAINIFTLSTS